MSYLQYIYIYDYIWYIFVVVVYDSLCNSTLLSSGIHKTMLQGLKQRWWQYCLELWSPTLTSMTCPSPLCCDTPREHKGSKRERPGCGCRTQPDAGRVTDTMRYSIYHYLSIDLSIRPSIFTYIYISYHMYIYIYSIGFYHILYYIMAILMGILMDIWYI